MGTIFTVDEITNQGRITGFRVDGNEMLVEFEGGSRTCLLSLVEKLPPQPQKEEQRIEVKRLQYNGSLVKDGYWNFNLWLTCGEIPYDKYEPIKKAVEKVLNDEIDDNTYSIGEINQKLGLYTKSEVDAMCEDAFNAARKIDFSGRYTALHHQFPTFQDYKKSKQ